MTEKIEPLYGVGQNPFLIEEAKHLQAQAIYTRGSSTAAGVEEADLARAKEPVQPSKTQAYVKERTTWLLSKARYFFFTRTDYATAAEFYKKYFQYLSYYKWQYHGIFGNYAQALFEFVWSQDIVGKQREAERFLNQQLLEQIEAGLKAGHAETPAVERYIETLQIEELLPTPQTLNQSASPDALYRLAQYLMSKGDWEFAQNILVQAEVRYLQRFYRSRQMAGEAARHLPPQEELAIASLPVQYAAQMQGRIPMAPSMPLMPGESERLHPTSGRPPAYAYYYTDKVDPVFGPNKDPNEEDKRRRRERKLKDRIQKKPRRVDDSIPK